MSTSGLSVVRDERPWRVSTRGSELAPGSAGPAITPTMTAAAARPAPTRTVVETARRRVPPNQPAPSERSTRRMATVSAAAASQSAVASRRLRLPPSAVPTRKSTPDGTAASIGASARWAKSSAA